MICRTKHVIAWLTRTIIRIEPISEIGFRLATRARKFYIPRCGPGEFAVRLRGVWWWISLYWHLGCCLFFHGTLRQDRGHIRVFESLLRPDSIVLDVGANIGFYSLLAASQLQDGRVHSFEPVPVNVERMKRNIALNGFDNITLNPQGAAGQAGQATLYVPADDIYNIPGYRSTDAASLNQGLATTTTEEAVELVTLDDYVQQQSIIHIDLIKIDVEGAELGVLEGAETLLERFRPQVLMEINTRALKQAGKTPADIFAFWQARHYAVYQIDHYGGLRLLEKPEDYVVAGIYEQNVLCRYIMD
jgi:FkbM family methyltransferase